LKKWLFTVIIYFLLVSFGFADFMFVFYHLFSIGFHLITSLNIINHRYSFHIHLVTLKFHFLKEIPHLLFIAIVRQIRNQQSKIFALEFLLFLSRAKYNEFNMILHAL